MKPRSEGADARISPERLVVLSPTYPIAYLDILRTALAKVGVTTAPFTPVTLLFGRYDVLHIHWPEEFVRDGPCRGSLKLVAYLACARLRRKGVVRTYHNLKPHKPLDAPCQRLVWRMLPRLITASIHLSEETRAVALAREPQLLRKPSVVTYHPHYRWYYGTREPVSTSRKKFGIPDEAQRVIGWLGIMRPYKGLEDLFRAFSALDDPHVALLAAGRPLDATIAKHLATAASEDRRVHLHARHIEDFEVAAALAAMNLAVLPFAQVHNSGSAILMLSYGVPILVPDSPTFRHLQRVAGLEWVQLYQGPLTTEVLASAIQSLPARTELPELAELDHRLVADQTRLCYRLSK